VKPQPGRYSDEVRPRRSGRPPPASSWVTRRCPIVLAVRVANAGTSQRGEAPYATLPAVVGNWQHWKDVLSEGWKIATGTGLGFVLGKVADLRKWRQERQAAMKRAAMVEKLLRRAGEQATLHKAHWDQARSLGGANTKNRQGYIRMAADAAEAYREAGDTVRALEWEQRARNTVP
jgi:hypothetical protein